MRGATANISLDEVNTTILGDPKHAAAIAAGRADFELGGVPARLSIESQGFKPIVTSFDLAKFAKPSPDSKELRSIFRDGWITTQEYWESNRETVLRLASVMFRITRYINDEPDKALDIHLPFVNSVAGTGFSKEKGMIAYKSLHPFATFEDQFDWFFNKNDSLNLDYEIGAYIKMWEEKGLFEKGEIDKSDVSIADEVYVELLGLKLESEQLFRQAEKALEAENNSKANKLLDKAKYYYDAYDFLDAKRFAKAAIDLAN